MRTVSPLPSTAVPLGANAEPRLIRALGTVSPFPFTLEFRGDLRSCFLFVVSNYTAEGAAHAGAQEKLRLQNRALGQTQYSKSP